MGKKQQTAIIGGGAAGFFCAINLKEMCPQMGVTIFEGGTRVLRKVKVSGGGRCNCTNTFEDVSDLAQVYPRGHRLLKRLFNVFNYRDAYQWFEHHGVPLTVQADHCVFPAAQDSQAIIDCFLHEAHRHDIDIRTNHKINSLEELSNYDYIVITTGGITSPSTLHLPPSTHPCPSLFTFRIEDAALTALMGTVINQAQTMLPGTKLRAEGPLLITHWGMSGPAILKLSSYGARLLADSAYRHSLSINWTGEREQAVMDELTTLTIRHTQKQLSNVRPFGLPARLWNYLTEKSLQGRAHALWGSLNKKELNRLVNILTNDQYLIAGRAPFKDEFVTCGGVSLSDVCPTTLESRLQPHLYFAGEVLDIDGITGGFNFQAAWTTAYVVAQSISNDHSRQTVDNSHQSC